MVVQQGSSTNILISAYLGALHSGNIKSASKTSSIISTPRYSWGSIYTRKVHPLCCLLWRCACSNTSISGCAPTSSIHMLSWHPFKVNHPSKQGDSFYARQREYLVFSLPAQKHSIVICIYISTHFTLLAILHVCRGSSKFSIGTNLLLATLPANREGRARKRRCDNAARDDHHPHRCSP